MARRWPVLVLCLAVGLGTTAATMPAPPAAAVAGPAHLADFYRQQVTWSSCGGTHDPALQCATITVPMNYRRPGAERISIAISRLTAKAPERRRGLLLLNPGGPGGSGLDLPTRFADRPIAQVYDLIGFDPRGVGQSTALSCEKPPAPGQVSSRPDDAEFAVWAANAQAQEAACQRAAGGLRPYVNTPNTARDMDVIRGVLGEKKINYLGFSYGTYLGAVYGTLFPRRLDRNVLDSAVGPDWIWREQAMRQAVATRENVDAWAAWTGERNETYGLGRSKDEVLAQSEALAAALATEPVVVDGTIIERTGYDVLLGARARHRPLWDALSQLVLRIRQLVTGAIASDSPEAIDAARAATLPPDAGIAPTTSGVHEAIKCEADWPRDLGVYFDDMRLYRERYPYGLGVQRAAPSNCTFRSFTPPEAPVDVRRSYPTGVVVQGEADTQTPYDGGVAMAVRLGHQLVSVADDGNHAQYLQNPCAQAAVDRYLVDGVLPGTRTVCPGEPRPDVPADGAVATAPSITTATPSLERRIAQYLHRGHRGLAGPASAAG
jgi:pimeloyl-ACP methyl ester carboxylesterase